MLSCRFNDAECNIDQDFVWYYDFFYGNCFRYNSGRDQSGKSVKLQESTTSGPLNGLQLEIFVGKTKDFRQALAKTGARVMVRDHNIPVHLDYF